MIASQGELPKKKKKVEKVLNERRMRCWDLHLEGISSINEKFNSFECQVDLMIRNHGFTFFSHGLSVRVISLFNELSRVSGPLLCETGFGYNKKYIQDGKQ